MLQYYICYKGRRLRGPMTREEAIAEMFELSHAFKGLSIQIVDSKTNKLKGEIKSKRRKDRK
ncbi:hypothetical protein J2TS4_49240 [Paenibacillus sp. J2TS4]|nr:hypothetical protein J2TS4_49240 [Paenibacillus sp. J2TS4]